MKFRVELAFRPASKSLIACSESASADGQRLRGRLPSAEADSYLEIPAFTRPEGPHYPSFRSSALP